MIMHDPIAERFTINPLVFLTGTVERTQDDERNPPALCPPSNPFICKTSQYMGRLSHVSMQKVNKDIIGDNDIYLPKLTTKKEMKHFTSPVLFS